MTDGSGNALTDASEISVPAPDDFIISAGQIDEVSIFSQERRASQLTSYVKLSVSGISEQDTNNLNISYEGTLLKGESGAVAAPFHNYHVQLIDERITVAVISPDRTKIRLTIEPGWHWIDNEGYGYVSYEDRLTIEIDGQYYYPDYSLGSQYSSYYTILHFGFLEPLPEGEATVIFDSIDLIGWSRETYPDALDSDVTDSATPGQPSAQYDVWRNRLIIAYNDDFIILGNKWSWKYKNAIENGEDIQIKYVKLYGDGYGQLADSFETPLPDFDYIPVIKQ